tara:strand:+ start:89 stop:538 length:450 start_codon:yes stop_codon:yes gene_type:complete
MDSLNIDGVFLTPLKEIFDERGSILKMLRYDESIFKGFGECYFSEINPGKIKAWKKHSLQTQNICVPIGKIKLVLFDSRKNSKTFKKLEIIELGRPNFYFRILIPPGICYGFSCISKSKSLIVNCTDIPHDSTESEIISITEKSIPFNW